MIRYDYQSPIGVLALVADNVALRGLSFENGSVAAPSPMRNRERTRSSMQLDAYFAGRGKTFDLPLAPDGTDLSEGTTTRQGDRPDQEHARRTPTLRAGGENPSEERRSSPVQHGSHGDPRSQVFGSTAV